MVSVDNNQRDYHVYVTRDIEGAIAAIGDSVPRGITVYFHLAQHSQAELCGLRDRMFNDRDELMLHGIVLMSGGCGSIDNRVNIGLSPASPEAIAYMEARYPGPVHYSGIGSLALRLFHPPEVTSQALTAVEDVADLALMTCGQRPFAAMALDESAPLSDGTGPEDEALQEALDIYVDIYGDFSSLTWIRGRTRRVRCYVSGSPWRHLDGSTGLRRRSWLGARHDRRMHATTLHRRRLGRCELVA